MIYLLSINPAIIIFEFQILEKKIYNELIYYRRSLCYPTHQKMDIYESINLVKNKIFIENSKIRKF